MTARRRRQRLATTTVSLLMSGVVLAALSPAPALAAPYDEPASTPPKSTSEPQRGTAAPASAPTQTCSIYGSSSGFGLLCSGGAAGKTLAQLFREAGVDLDKPFCWDDPNLPDGFVPERQADGPGRWWLYTCLSFDGAVLKSNARLSYEYRYHRPGNERELTDTERPVIELVTGRGQIPFLQVQTSPVSSPRVDQDVAFTLLCDGKVRCSDTPEGRRIVTPELQVGGVTMFAELVHLRVLPEGASRPGRAVDCVGGGLERTAEQLDREAENDPRVCRWSYERSSNDAGGGTRGDRYPARVTAYWQIFVDEGAGPRPFGDTYEKTTANQIRVTEVQTLVVS